METSCRPLSMSMLMLDRVGELVTSSSAETSCSSSLVWPSPPPSPSSSPHPNAVHASAASTIQTSVRDMVRLYPSRGQSQPPHGDRRLGHEAEQAVERALVEPGRGEVGVDPDVARAGAAEADQPRLAVPPQQHPGVELARAVE